MARVQLEANSFDEIPTVSELNDQSHADGSAWTGSATSMTTGLGGSGQAVVGPSSLKFSHFDHVTYTSLGVAFKFKLTTVSVLQTLVRLGGDLEIRATAGNFLQVYGGAALGFTDTSATNSVVVDRIDTIEFWVHVNNTDGRYRVVHNGSNVADISVTGGIDTYTTGLVSMWETFFSNGNIVIDDVVIMGEEDKFLDTDFITQPGRAVGMISLHPMDQGTYAQFDNVTDTGAENWMEVDDLIADGTGSYIAALIAAGDGSRDSYLIQDISSLVDVDTVFSVLAVQSQAQWWTDNSGDWGRLFLRHNGANYEGGDATLAFQYTHREQRWATIPGEADTWEDVPAQEAFDIIDGLEIGVRQRGIVAGSLTKMSQIVLRVVYLTGPQPEEPSSSSSLTRYRRAHRLVKTWLVQRRDEVEYAFTDHDHALILNGTTYEPAGGLSGSAIRRELMLKDQSEEFVGIVSSDAITVDDLRAGRFRDAVAVERVVDWRYPWRGDVIRSQYYVGEVKWNDKMWQAEVSGKPHRLQRRHGFVIGSVCRWKVGHAGCLVDMGPFTHSAAVAAVSNRRTFTGDAVNVPAVADGWFELAEVEWTSGPNDGIVSEVMAYTGSSRSFSLFIKLPFDIGVGNTFILRRGCDGLKSTCQDVFGNFPNFGGEPFVPGRNKVIRSVQ